LRRFAPKVLIVLALAASAPDAYRAVAAPPPDARSRVTHDPVASALRPDLEEGEPKLYDDAVLRNVALTFEDNDWKRRLEQMDAADPVDLPASLTVDGYTLDRVGARYKGNTSQRVNSPKKPFNIKTQAFVDGQDLWGYDVINLNNAATDPSMLREAVAYRILRDYMPVPQASFARVSAQGEYLGVYLMVEQINREMVDAWFPTDDGIIIKGDPPTGAKLNTSALKWLGEALSEYEQYYEVKTAGFEQAGYEHLRELARALDAPSSRGGLSDDRFAEEIPEVLDVEAALWYLAGSNLLQNGDSYYAGHNYYVYETARDPRFHMLLWDLNMAFGLFPIGGMGGRPPPGEQRDLARQSPFTSEDNRDRPLIRRLLAVPDIRADYVAHLRDLRDEAFTPERVGQIALTYQDLIRESVREEPDPIFPYSQFEQNLRDDVSTGGGRGRSRTAPGLLTLAGERYTYMRDHPDLQSPDVLLAEHALVPSEPTAEDAVEITATFAGVDDVTSAELRYRVDGGVENIIQMTRVAAAIWRTTVPAQREGRDVSYVFRVGLSDGRVAFFPSATLTRPFAYRVGGVELGRGETGDLVINELMAANDSTVADEAGEFDDWIELFNRGTNPVDLSGYHLSDDPADPWAYPLPGLHLGPGEYMLIWCDNDLDQGPNHAPFALSRDGESAVLSMSDTIVDQIDFGPQDADVSLARSSDGEEPWVTCQTPSPGAPNDCGSAPPTEVPPTPTSVTPTITPTAKPPTPAPAWSVFVPYVVRQ